MSSAQTLYRAYMIRLWPTQRMGTCDCRVTLEEVATHERKEFPDLDTLFGYLHTQAEAQFSDLEEGRSQR